MKPYYQDSACTIFLGDCVTVLREMEANSVHCCVTSPPYWGLRDYGCSGQIGLEKTPEEYVAKMVEVFREVKRVLRDDGTLWLNLGDSYAGNGKAAQATEADTRHATVGALLALAQRRQGAVNGLKPKDLVGIPWRVAFALQADGWYLRSDIIWCLSGGTWIYVWTEDSGECLMTIKDLYRIKGRGVMLWTGGAWTRLLGMSASKRTGKELEIVLRSGERISCTPNHQFPTVRGLLKAGDIRRGDILERCHLPEPYPRKDGVFDQDAAWMCGLYIAEGSRSEDTIQISGHSKEEGRWKRLESIAEKFGGTAKMTVVGNSMSIRIYGRVLNAIVDNFVSGRLAQDKCFAPTVWRMSNSFIEAMVDGYLSGDGHYEEKNNRWRLGFCRNYNLERDLRTACARLGWHLVLRLSTVLYKGKKRPSFRGELRKGRSGHWNERDTAEVIEIRAARCRNVYDLGVCSEPHLFSLASGILTHNSKPNPMPESVTDRPTKSHEYIFLLSKNERYFYDAEAIKESAVAGFNGSSFTEGKTALNGERKGLGMGERIDTGFRNRRTVWTVATYSYAGAHFATYPPDLIKPCILAGTSARGCCPKCGAPWERIVNHTPMKIERSKRTHELGRTRSSGTMTSPAATNTIGWQPGCDCDNNEPIPCTVLDPFGGSGTTGQVALEHGRKAILIELNPEYAQLAQRRTNVTPGLTLA